MTCNVGELVIVVFVVVAQTEDLAINLVGMVRGVGGLGDLGSVKSLGGLMILVILVVLMILGGGGESSPTLYVGPDFWVAWAECRQFGTSSPTKRST